MSFGRGSFRALDDVLAAASGRLRHLVVLAAFGIVELCARLAVVEGQEAAAEAQRLDLHDRRQRERVQPPETAVLVEEFRHQGKGGGRW